MRGCYLDGVSLHIGRFFGAAVLDLYRDEERLLLVLLLHAEKRIPTRASNEAFDVSWSSQNNPENASNERNARPVGSSAWACSIRYHHHYRTPRSKQPLSCSVLPRPVYTCSSHTPQKMKIRQSNGIWRRKYPVKWVSGFREIYLLYISCFFFAMLLELYSS